METSRLQTRTAGSLTMTDTANEERHNGSIQIIERLKEMAQEEAVEITRCVWNGGGSILNRERQSLEVTTRDGSITVAFSDEQVADYPGRTGTERTEAMLRDVLRRLRAGKKER